MLVRRLTLNENVDVLAYLASRPEPNLLLLDTTMNIGCPPLPGEAPADVVTVWDGDAIVGVASLRPIVMLDDQFPEEAVVGLAPHFRRLRAGLLKCSPPLAERAWVLMEQMGFASIVDRSETNYWVHPDELASAPIPEGAVVREAGIEDIESLVIAARASLWEEGRPDPHDQDPEGFQNWVRGRMANATVVEVDGEVAFVGYADVQRSEGWLLQGIYTWPTHRRKGYALAGVAELCRRAFASGAEHVQLAVVNGNRGAEELYQRIGFKPFEELRTILFT